MENENKENKINNQDEIKKVRNENEIISSTEVSNKAINQDEEIGKFILKCRKDKKLTQTELAEKLGVTDKSISNWENGRNMPDLSLLFNILTGNITRVLLNGMLIF